MTLVVFAIGFVFGALGLAIALEVGDHRAQQRRHRRVKAELQRQLGQLKQERGIR